MITSRPARILSALRRPLLVSASCTAVFVFGAFAAAPVEPGGPRKTADVRPESVALDLSETGTLELYRLRIANRADGAIQVSTDGGAIWRLIGRVMVPATGTQEGYLAAEYAAPGTVAATAVHGHRIRISAPDPTLHAPLLISIDPKEYVKNVLPTSYGGHRPGVSGMYTDIPAGTSLFRELAPINGSTVLLESASTGRLFPVPSSFRPRGDGEVIVIPVRMPKNALIAVTFENRGGGKVEGVFADGTTRQITQTVQPVQGVGRFDGTAYTGVGRLNTAHTGVLTVSTAPVDGALPEGQGRERRGGFQIAPAWHNARTPEAGAPMVLVIGEFGKPRRSFLEGQAPLFHGMIGLGEQGQGSQTRCEMSVDGGKWEPLPALLGSRPDAFTGLGLTRFWKARGIARASVRGVTGFRLSLPPRSPSETQTVARSVADAYRVRELASARSGKMPIVRGRYTFSANPTGAAGVASARFSIEGEVRGFTNAAPFSLSWDTRSVADGAYLLETDALDESGEVRATTRRRVFVLNH
ncbi:MAG: Ig-like domain-containing protein [Cytophagales bacterium]|nr:Ig-like domain-containing protein [Armatimonadota bacterium]